MSSCMVMSMALAFLQCQLLHTQSSANAREPQRPEPGKEALKELGEAQNVVKDTLQIL